VRPILKDYGIDCEIELVDQESVTGNRIWVQIKSVEEISFQCMPHSPKAATRDQILNKNETKFTTFSLSTKEVSYALQCAFPLLLFVADLKGGDIYWLPIRDHVMVNLKKRNWQHQTSVSVRIPALNNLSGERSGNYSGLRWYALEPARMNAFFLLHRYHH